MPERPPLGRETIGVLVVEDDALLRMSTAEVFIQAGMAVFEAGDADAALAILERRRDIGVLVTDLDMPAGTISGDDLVRTVAARWPDLGVVVLSGGRSPRPGNLPPGVRFVAKPSDAPSLVAAAFAIVSRQTGSI